MATPKKQKQKIKWLVPKGEAGSIDLPFLIMVLCLLTVGLVMLSSASYVSALQRHGDSYYFIKRQLLFAMAGVAFMLVIPYFNYQLLRRWALRILIVAVVLLGLIWTPLGVEVNGARRWLNLGIQFQPSEIAKFAVIVILASYMASNYKRMKEFKVGILLPGLVLVGVCALVVAEPHVSGAILIFAIGIVMMYVGGVNLGWFVGLGGIGGLGLLGAAFLIPHARARLNIWLHPEVDPTGDGFQTLQSLYAIGSGGFFGRGLGQSVQKHLYIPEPQNDYIFVIVCEELGFVGAIFVIVLFVALVWRGVYISFHAKDKFASLLVMGIISRVAIQTFLNMAVVTNTLPPTGISLPFFSYGGTSLVILLVEMGIILAVSRQSKQEITA